jgi:hypothetical protein
MLTPLIVKYTNLKQASNIQYHIPISLGGELMGFGFGGGCKPGRDDDTLIIIAIILLLIVLTNGSGFKLFGSE